MSDIVSLTASYETWLRSAIEVVEPDLATKHTELAATPLRFLRGTYYYWLTRMPVLLPELLAAPTVALVGDLHAENFGTWSDRRGVRRWGVNDLDELGLGPYPIDLVRLATSCVLSPHVTLDEAEICDVILDAWAGAEPGHAVKVDDAQHLHHLLPDAAPIAEYYPALETGERVDASVVPPRVRDVVSSTVTDSWSPHWHRRVAGTGSLGHPRFVGIDHNTAREVKVLGPPTATWAHLAQCRTESGLYETVEDAVRGPANARRVDDWQVRELAPDVVRIDIGALHPHSTERVLRSMARASADIHGDRIKAAQNDAAKRPAGWLRDAVAAMAEDTRAAYDDWRAASHR